MESMISTKKDALCRETTLGEGQVEELSPITTADCQNQQNSGSPSCEDDDDGDDAPNPHYHPSIAGAYRPPGAAGYEHLAEFMTTTQHGIVRKYKELSMLNLLYLQAEIHELRKEWDMEVAADARAGLEGGEREGEEHDDAIKRHEHICSLPTPSNDQRTFLSGYIASDDLNGGRGAFLSSELRGDHPEAYREEWLDDLAMFEHGPEAHDAFARWVVMPVLKAAHFLWLGKGKKPIHSDPEAGLTTTVAAAAAEAAEKSPPAAGPHPVIPIHQYNATGYMFLNRTLNAIVIILVPCAAIVSLNAVPDANKRVGMICAFSLVCAIGMAVCSAASRIEIFAVSAAFMSVQLVFVGQQQGGN